MLDIKNCEEEMINHWGAGLYLFITNPPMAALERKILGKKTIHQAALTKSLPMGALCPQKLNYEKKTTGVSCPSMDGRGKEERDSASLGL